MADCIATIILGACTACMGYLSYKAVCIFLARSLILHVYSYTMISFWNGSEISVVIVFDFYAILKTFIH